MRGGSGRGTGKQYFVRFVRQYQTIVWGWVVRVSYALISSPQGVAKMRAPTFNKKYGFWVTHCVPWLLKGVSGPRWLITWFQVYLGRHAENEENLDDVVLLIDINCLYDLYIYFFKIGLR